MKTKNIAIVGGGTAGLVTALILGVRYPKLKIDIIESDKIGIVGVGEGSTEHWKDFIQETNISLKDLVNETDCTFKYGINFDNWHGDNTNYIHSVSTDLSVESQTRSKVGYAHMIANGLGPKDIIHDYIEPSLHIEPFWGVNQFHFDTMKLNTFLHSVCEKRNISIIKAEIENVKLDSDGAVEELVTSDGQIFKYDFYIDSTGFHRLIMQKTMGIGWKSYSEYLPVNSAFAFPTEGTEDIPSWTLAKAMKAGWLWRIPTQSRYGNGYVYSDKYTTFEEAKAEVEELYGHPIDVRKEFKFDAGRLEKFWHKNCAAVGLSSSFIEPLEASSIGSTIVQALELASLLASYIPGNTYSEEKFNKFSTEVVDNIIDYVALHYITKREDSDFWKDAKNLPKPPGLEKLLEIYKHKFPSEAEFRNRSLMFKESNWIVVMHGLGLIDPKVAQEEVDMQNDYMIENLYHNLTYRKEDENRYEKFSHRHALEWMKTTKEIYQ